MQALRKLNAAPGLDLDTVAAPPAPGPGEVLLRVLYAGICGTDLHIDAWDAGYHFIRERLPVTVGHEFSGEVAALGAGVEGLRTGQRVAVRPSVTCGRCAACSRGDFDACTSRLGIGVSRDGGFASHVRVPARNCVPAPAGVDADLAAMAEPLSVSHESVRVGGVRTGDRVLVLGPGNIGAGIAVFARAAGARQVVVAGHGDAARFAVLRQMGFHDLVDLASETLEPFLREGRFDVVIEAAGSPAAVATGLAALKVHGVFVVTGIHAAPVPVDLTALVRNHQQLRGSYRAPEAAWPEVLAFLAAHADLLRPMVTHRLPLARAQDGFALARSRQATKVLFDLAGSTPA
ncbi:MULTISPECIES: zinc-dependent alcohol dehydrogenase [Ramlibacter]|uniref:Alcohol dehydrogenase catalytic domain-containing protein n=1 Tax=Ramlibacter pinisoli TaxID=2682844 RepID=A0A6N8IWV3_9BURK|nr:MULTISPECIES: alcohol dehydrogenase catalytic domain-containing protein [Ramlibacter]MBA2961516.1 alcohol dehydrogenase catalytic domain-containing protein [Ramlibacter sp. CGMCC 1.13660]MVQ31459.1 alcohol dehydrogenase catalytic domain-containing protein [Ramlibacter pinisoli]